MPIRLANIMLNLFSTTCMVFIAFRVHCFDEVAVYANDWLQSGLTPYVLLCCALLCALPGALSVIPAGPAVQTRRALLTWRCPLRARCAGRRHVHSSLYDQLRTNLPRELMGFL